MQSNIHHKNGSDAVEQSAQLWIDLEKSRDYEEFGNAWLAIQCSLIEGCLQGVLVLSENETGTYAPVASWSVGVFDGERLSGILDHTLSEGERMFVELPRSHTLSRGEGMSYGISYPVKVDDGIFGAVALEISSISEEKLRPAMEGLQWGAVWLENMFRRRRNEEDTITLTRLKDAVHILACALAEDRFEGAAMAFVTEIATRMKCDRVSLGLIKRKHARVKVVSHSAVIGKNMSLVRSIGAAMDEAVMQGVEIIYPPPPGFHDVVIRDHAAMAQRHGTTSMITIPLQGKDGCYAALSLERQDDREFTLKELGYVRSVASLSGPVLEDKYHNDRLVAVAVADSVKRQIARLLGGGYLGRKLIVLFLALLIAFFSQAKGEYRLAADTVLEGAISRSIVAPMDGYIDKAPVRAGDVVKKGIVMCTLDDRDLRLERLNWLGKRRQYQRQYREAMAEHNRVEVAIISAQIDQTEAQLKLVNSKLQRIVIRAPFQGIVLTGDLSQRLGGAVEHGEELFQIAPLDAYRVILKVDERRIRDVVKGQKGMLVLSSLPAEKYEFTVEKITPLTTAEEGNNYFRVEAGLEKTSSRIRPGMEGVGKIYVDERLLVTIWTRGLIDWFRLWLWKWRP